MNAVRRAGRGGRRRRHSPLVVEHLRAAREGLLQLRTNLPSVLVSIAAMAVVLALPAVLYALLAQQQALFEQWGAEPTMTLFLERGTTLAAATQRAEALRRLAGVAEVALIRSEEAFAELAAGAGLSTAAFGIDNPLPHVLVVTPHADAWREAGAAQLAERLRASPGIDSVLVDLAWVDRLRAIGTLATRALWVLSALLLAGTVLVIGNAIRAAVQEQAAEIEVLKLVGATDGFVRRPFLYSGALYGLAAGMLAVALVESVMRALAGPVEAVSRAYLSAFTLSGVDAAFAGALIAVAGAIGWCGGWIGTAHSLRRLERRL